MVRTVGIEVHVGRGSPGVHEVAPAAPRRPRRDQLPAAHTKRFSPLIRERDHLAGEPRRSSRAALLAGQPDELEPGVHLAQLAIELPGVVSMPPLVPV